MFINLLIFIKFVLISSGKTKFSMSSCTYIIFALKKMITIDRSSAQTTSEQTGGALTGLTEASRNSSQNGSPPPIPPLPEFELQPNKGTFLSSPSFTYDLHIDTEATYLPSPQDIMGCYYL